MSTRKPSPRFRAVRPSPEALEDRQLLSATVSGTDLSGDKWTLNLQGPGTMNVSIVTPNGPEALTPALANTPAMIDTITISGTSSVASKLIGTVQKAAGSDGRVFFQNLIETGGGAQGHIDNKTPIGALVPPVVTNGILSIVMPNFWLGNARGTTPPEDGRSSIQLPAGQVPNYAEVGKINIPDGVSTIDFGGVDATFTPPGGTPLNTTGQNNRFNINLGVPYILGTSIIVNSVITDAAPANTTTGTGPFQNTVFFNVAGRVSLFQANQILGNTNIPGTQFANKNPTSTSSLLAGGTYLISEDFDQILTQDFTNNNQQFYRTLGLGVTGQAGNIRIGGNATNFTVLVDNNPASASSGGSASGLARISNISFGGETNNVLVVAGGSIRNAFFGKGLDNAWISADSIGNLQANRDVTNSIVTVDRGIQRFSSGGDVTASHVQAGYQQTLETEGAGAQVGQPVPTILNRTVNSAGNLQPVAQNGGQINARIGGNVLGSVFSAGVEPVPTQSLGNAPGIISQPSGARFPFGEPDNIIYPRNAINAKVEGTIDNSGIVSPTNVPGVLSVAQGQGNQAFFAKSVHVTAGPVVPPNVPEAPYPGTVYHRGQRGVRSTSAAHPTGPLSNSTR